MVMPTLYNDEMLQKATDYLTDYPGAGDVVPSISGLSLYLGIGRETVRLWSKAEDKEPFAAVIDKIMAMQEQKLLCGGLLGDYNASIAKLMLTKHGYHDKQDSTLAAPDGGPVQITKVERVIVNPSDTHS